jgi:threonylcarbamoyladenosine tRNA methylthiotransferase CDKAL1
MNGMIQVYIDANGCEETRLDAQRLKNLICGSDYVCTDEVSLADIIVFYACGHLQVNENESVRIIKRLMSLKKSSGRLVVGGCLPKINPEAIRSIYEGCMVGPEEWDFFCDLFNQSKERIHNVYANELCTLSKLTSPNTSSRSSLSWLNTLINEFGRARVRSEKNWYIKIISGCRENCTYCSDRLAFKCCESQPIETIISQFELGLKSGFKNFNLVGRDLGSYGYDLGSDLPTLLNKMLENHTAENYKLRLYNISPRSLVDFYPKLKEPFSSGKISQIGNHVQSGSCRILGLMGRRYTTRESLKIVKEIKEKFPDISIDTSIIVGFPTETERDFDKSMDLLNSMLFDHFDLYTYEERPNLPSLRLKGVVPYQVKKMRLNRLRRKLILNNINKNVKRIKIGSLIQSLIELSQYWL